MALQPRYAPLLVALFASRPLTAQGGPPNALSAVAKYAAMIRAIETWPLDSLFLIHRKWPDDKLEQKLVDDPIRPADSASTAYYRLASRLDDVATDLEARVAPPSLVKVHDQFVALLRQFASAARMEYDFALWCRFGDRRCHDLDSQTDVILATANALIAKGEVTRRIESMMVEAGAPPRPDKP